MNNSLPTPTYIHDMDLIPVLAANSSPSVVCPSVCASFDRRRYSSLLADNCNALEHLSRRRAVGQCNKEIHVDVCVDKGGEFWVEVFFFCCCGGGFLSFSPCMYVCMYVCTM